MRRALALLAASAALAGCSRGGGDELAQEASKICEQRRAEVSTVRRPGALILFDDYLTKVLPILRRERQQVEALDGADSGDAERMLLAWTDVLEALADMQQGAKAGSDIGIVIPLRRAAAAERRADKAARGAGADACVGFNPFT